MKEVSKNNWKEIYEYLGHKNILTCISFAPYEYGLILLCGSLDGYISLHEYRSIKI